MALSASNGRTARRSASSGSAVVREAPQPAHHLDRPHATPGTPSEMPRVPGTTVTGMLRGWMLSAKRRGLPRTAVTRLIRWMEQQADAIWGPT